MDYCKYHPLEGATFVCRQCAIYQCDKCVDDDTPHHNTVKCFVCGSVLESLGSANKVEPFWRRLSEAFKYPLNSSSISIIVITSIISVLAILMPFLFVFAILMYLFAAGSMLKYSFTCLMQTALGEMKAPDVMDAYQGGIKLLFQLVVMTAVLMAIVGVAAHYMGAAFGGLFGLIAILSYPAILIRFAQTENMLDAMNPFAALALMAAIGLPYGLLIVFMLIMMTSVGVLHQWIGEFVPALSYLLQTMVSSYYMLVVFHLMGYMLFQYQSELGYTARADDGEEAPKRSDVERMMAKIDVMLKEGDYAQVVKLYFQAFGLFPQETKFYDRYFDLLYVCKKKELMQDYAPRYLDFLIKKNRLDKLIPSYKQILLVAPEYLPDSPAIRVQFAGLLRQQGDARLAIKLLNGMHKLYPDYAGLVDAYRLLADTLAELPNMQVQVEKCQQLILQLQRKAEEKQIALERKKVNAAVGDALLIEDKTASASKDPRARRHGAPRAATPLVLELVPIEPAIEREEQDN